VARSMPVIGGKPGSPRFSRRTLLGGSLAASAAVLQTACDTTTSGNAPVTKTSDEWSRALKQLDAKIESAMQADAIPGAAVGVILGDRQYLRGYGVTSVNTPTAVDADTVFRIQSTTKTFTGTALMRLVDQGRLDLDARVRRYLPDFATTDEKASGQVTVRQLANHTAGWLGDYFPGFNGPDGALAQYVASMRTLPQLTAPGAVFAYSNAAICTAGRIVEVVIGSPYRAAIQSLLISPLGLSDTYFSSDPPAANAAVPHIVEGDKAVVDLSGWDAPRSEDPTGGLISSVRDQMQWARFHLGDGRAPNGAQLLRPQSLVEMQSRPGRGGTLLLELDGMGVTWMLRPSAEGALIVQHGGSGTGQLSGFVMVPSRRFAMTLLTNSDGASSLRTELLPATGRCAGLPALATFRQRPGNATLWSLPRIKVGMSPSRSLLKGSTKPKSTFVPRGEDYKVRSCPAGSLKILVRCSTVATTYWTSTAQGN
jgi:CubicO group peptidase (beta-lactamase class C family)